MRRHACTHACTHGGELLSHPWNSLASERMCAGTAASGGPIVVRRAGPHRTLYLRAPQERASPHALEPKGSAHARVLRSLSPHAGLAAPHSGVEWRHNTQITPPATILALHHLLPVAS